MVGFRRGRPSRRGGARNGQRDSAAPQSAPVAPGSALTHVVQLASPGASRRSVDAPSRFPKESTMSLTLNSPAATAAGPTPTSESFRVLLEDQRADCVRQRELALAEAATSMPDPVAHSRAALMARPIGEIAAGRHRI